MNELQIRGSSALREDGREMPGTATVQAEDLETERQLTVGSATININHVDTLVIQHGPLERDIEGQTYMCGL